MGVIFLFLIIILEEATLNSNATVPWMKLTADAKSFIEEKYFPKGLVIQDPSKMVVNQNPPSLCSLEYYAGSWHLRHQVFGDRN